MKTVSLFAGAGGLDLGFHRAGFDIIWANDINKDACETHDRWSSAVIINKDIQHINMSDIPNCDVLIGGFPCQGFSLAGPRKVDDSRNLLYRFYVETLISKKPMVFIAENVKGILTLGEGEILKKIQNDFENAGNGYNVTIHTINASDYGVPQDRQRVFFVGISKDFKKTIPFELDLNLKENKTIKDVLDTSSTFNIEDLCIAPFSSRFMSRNRKREWNQYAYTVPAMAKQVTLHPSSPDMIKLDKDLWTFGDGLTRRFTWREAALIQTFPSTLNFAGDLVSKYKQIGNAVPVTLAEKVALMIKNYVESR